MQKRFTFILQGIHTYIYIYIANATEACVYHVPCFVIRNKYCVIVM